MIRAARQALHSHANADKARTFKKFYKTGKGDYAEGDQLIGVVVPDIRKVAKQFEELSLSKVLTLLNSHVHEEQLLALLILVRQYQRGASAIQEQIVNAYLANLEYVYNWDLVDSSAPDILGSNLLNKKGSHRAVLYQLVGSPRHPPNAQNHSEVCHRTVP